MTMSVLPDLTAAAGGVRVNVKVVPRARRTAIEGVRDGRLVVRVTAPPVDGAANEAAIDALAEALDVPRRSVRVVAGATSRNKTIEIAAVGVDHVAARLQR